MYVHVCTSNSSAKEQANYEHFALLACLAKKCMKRSGFKATFGQPSHFVKLFKSKPSTSFSEHITYNFIF